ncbi:MAG TPA: hypothetical protein VL356_13810 [Acidocella sp.]|nr:hypothetical protein [Acidocella sp.]
MTHKADTKALMTNTVTLGFTPTRPLSDARQRIINAAKAYGETHGVASLKAVVERYGAKAMVGIDPARWPQLYNELIAGACPSAAA